jgi:hypothetical protein
MGDARKSLRERGTGRTGVKKEENATGADWGDKCTTPDVPEHEDSSGAEPLHVRDGSMWGLVDMELECGGTYDHDVHLLYRTCHRFLH